MKLNPSPASRNAAQRRILSRGKIFILRILALNGTPRGIALGFALGLFLSVIPTFGIGMVAALALAPLFKANLPATYLGTAMVNPVTGIFIYTLNFLVGNWILGGEAGLSVPRRLSELWPQLGRIGVPLYLGGLILAVIFSAVSYLLIYNGISVYRGRKDGGGV